MEKRDNNNEQQNAGGVRFTSGYQDIPLHFRDRPEGRTIPDERINGSSVAQGRPHGEIAPNERPDGENASNERPNGGNASNERPDGENASNERLNSAFVPDSGSADTHKKSGEEWLADISKGRRVSADDEACRGLSDEMREVLKQMYAVSSSYDQGSRLDAYIFYQQGRIVSGLEDNFPVHERYQAYYPTYRSMTLRQLRQYLTWRTAWRKFEKTMLSRESDTRTRTEHQLDRMEDSAGEKASADWARILTDDAGQTSASLYAQGSTLEENVTRYVKNNISFAYMHAYELINNTDDIPAEEGYRKLAILYRTFGQHDGWFRTHLWRWLRDFAVYYQVDPAITLSEDDGGQAEAIHTLEGYERYLRTVFACGTESESREEVSEMQGVEKRSSEAAGTGYAEDASNAPVEEKTDAKDSPDTNDGEKMTAVNASDRPDTEVHDRPDLHAVFRAICCLSSRDPSKSPYYRKHAEDLEEVCVRSYAAVCRFYMQNGKRMLLETMYGGKDNFLYYMFQTAIFYDRLHYDNFSCAADASHVFVCHDGRWTCERYLFLKKKDPFLGDVMREAERNLRDLTGYTTKLTKKIVSSALAEVIAQTVEVYLQEKREAARPKVNIQLDKLGEIRQNAAHTRNQLIVDDAEFVDPIAVLHTGANTMSAGHSSDITSVMTSGITSDITSAMTSGITSDTTSAMTSGITSGRTADRPSERTSDISSDLKNEPSKENARNIPAGDNRTSDRADGGFLTLAQEEMDSSDMTSAQAESDGGVLTPAQKDFLRVLLAGGDGKAYVHAHPELGSVSLLADDINEALFDQIGDTVIEVDGDTPTLIADYREDVENCCH